MPRRVRRLANRKDDVLDELWQQEDIGDVRLECLLEHARRPARGNDQDRGASVLANSCKLVRGQTRAPGRMEDGVQVAARQRRSAVGDMRARADEFDFRVSRERLAKLLEAFARTRCVDADALAFLCLRCVHQRYLRRVEASSTDGLLSLESAGGRSSRYSFPFSDAQRRRCDWVSVTRSWTLKFWSPDVSLLD